MLGSRPPPVPASRPSAIASTLEAQRRAGPSGDGRLQPPSLLQPTSSTFSRACFRRRSSGCGASPTFMLLSCESRGCLRTSASGPSPQAPTLPREAAGGEGAPAEPEVCARPVAASSPSSPSKAPGKLESPAASRQLRTCRFCGSTIRA